MKPPIDETDARLLEALQREFPLSVRPYDDLASNLRIAPEQVISRIARLKAAGIIRRINAIFESAALGHRSALVAFRIRPDALDEVAARVSAHRGVSHCYSRDAAYNLWFTLTLPAGHDPQAQAEALRGPGVESMLYLPALRVFKIGVFLRMTDDDVAAQAPPSGAFLPLGTLSEHDTSAAKVLQSDLPLTERPFAELAGEAGMSEQELLDRAHGMLESGVMRRYGATLNHLKAGYTSNAMICWRVPPECVDQIGHELAGDPSVSHCYERPTYPDWPYTIYTMIHCRTDAELDAAIQRLAGLSGGAEHLVLRTVKEYKKTRVNYFD